MGLKVNVMCQGASARCLLQIAPDYHSAPGAGCATVPGRLCTCITTLGHDTFYGLDLWSSQVNLEAIYFAKCHKYKQTSNGEILTLLTFA